MFWLMSSPMCNSGLDKTAAVVAAAGVNITPMKSSLLHCKKRQQWQRCARAIFAAIFMAYAAYVVRCLYLKAKEVNINLTFAEMQ